MNILFISMSARIIRDENGQIYLNWHMNSNTIKRYSRFADNFKILLRDSNRQIESLSADEKYNLFPEDVGQLIVGYNPYFPLKNWFNIHARIDFSLKMKEEIKWADRVIIGSANGFYTERAIRYCKLFKKQYMLINGGFAFENSWNNKNILGKVMAFSQEWNCKKNLREAPYALYVTEYVLQRRYPCYGKTLGCSDVEIPKSENLILKRRLEKIKRKQGHLVLGTAASVDTKLKGQKYVIKALEKIKKEQGCEIEYQLLGGGSPQKLTEEAIKRNVANQVKFLGEKPHKEVYEWLDSIDIYIQPSFTEGMSRSIIEAMSRACPVICSTAGGNVELVNPYFSFQAGHVKEIISCIQKISCGESMLQEAKNNFVKSYKYESDKLDRLRSDFLKEFISDNTVSEKDGLEKKNGKSINSN